MRRVGAARMSCSRPSGRARRSTSRFASAAPRRQVTWIGNSDPRVELGMQDVVTKELTLRGAYGYVDEFDVAARAIADRRVDVRPLIERRAPLDDAIELFAELAHGAPGRREGRARPGSGVSHSDRGPAAARSASRSSAQARSPRSTPRRSVGSRAHAWSPSPGATRVARPHSLSGSGRGPTPGSRRASAVAVWMPSCCARRILATRTRRSRPRRLGWRSSSRSRWPSIPPSGSVIATARRNGVLLSVISQRRWYPAVRRVKAAIDEGRIGTPALATLEVLGWRGPEYYAMDAWRGTQSGEGGGVLVNQAVHQLDLLCWFLGEPVEVDGFTANVNHPEIEVEDTAVAVVRFASGALATLTASNAQRPGLWGRVHVHGRNGSSVGVETDRGSSFVAGMSAPSPARNDLWTIPGEAGLVEHWPAEDAARRWRACGSRDLLSRASAARHRRCGPVRAGSPPSAGEDGRRAWRSCGRCTRRSARPPAWSCGRRGDPALNRM